MRLASTALSLLVIAPVSAQTVKTILNNGPVQNRYDIVILGDGYRDVEEPRFDQDAQNALAAILAKPAWGTYRSYFNVHTVFRASAESGVDQPDVTPPIFKNTAYDGTYNYGGTPRCVYIQNQGLATSDSRLAPDVEGRVIVLVNDSRYGGCAGTFAVSYNGSSGPEVQAHEFGHAFGGLADEYDYGLSGTYTGPEPSQANLTAESTGSVKWPLWLGTQGVSAFVGAGYYQSGMWRPKADCLMRNLFVPMCPVCSEQIVLSAYRTVDPIENPSPAAGTLTVVRPSTQSFAFQNLVPGSSAIEWSVDGASVATGTTSFNWSSAGVRSGRHTVTVTVTDLTAFVRKDPTMQLVSSHSWTVDVVSSQSGSYTMFGFGCSGSRPTPSECLTLNTGNLTLGFPTIANTTYAVSAIAPSTMTVSAFELHTSSRLPTSVPVPIALYTADGSGRPAARVATGTMQVGSTVGWYEGALTTPHQVQTGETFFIAFTVPPVEIHASIANGIPTPYFLDNGPGGSWNGPLLTYPWTYKVKCAIGTGLVPRLMGRGAPEIGTSFDVLLDLALPSTSAALFVGSSNAMWNSVPLPIGLGPLGAAGCSILASGEIIAPVVVNATGAASLTIAIPDLAALVGAVFYNQFYVVDPLANGSGLAWSNGGTATVGK